MKHLLACRRDGQMWYLPEVQSTTGSLTPHKDQARVFLSLSNAQEAAEKYRKSRGRVDRDRPKLFVMPLRED